MSTRDVGALDLGTWHSVGPFFAKTADEAFATDYGPEAVPLDLAAVVGTDARWRERPEWIDGQEHLFEGANAAMYAARRITAPTARRLRLALGSDDALKVWLNGELQHENNTRRPLAPGQDRVDLELPPGENQLLLKVVNAGGGFGFHFEVELEDAFNVPLDMARAVSLAATERDEADVALLRGAYRREAWPEYGAHEERLAALRSERAAVEAEVPRTMITRDRETPRPTHVLIRGQYDQKGAEVQPGVPAILPPLAPAEPERGANRLDLARWLVDPDHPLTARVTVNRFWQQVFGIGLVETAEDFGTRGAWPSHPELLDALALDFVEGGWDVKGLMRRLVTSATYRQSARVTPDRLALDPENRLLSRGPRQRLDAETLRDTALFVSGLLVERIGGPSVKPYQPGGLWKAVGYTSSNTANFVQDSGDKLYRRSLYTFWKRTSPPPTMAILDAPTRETCTVQRARTNTPLQALALMNDVQFVEAARAFAERILREGGSTEDERLVFAFRSVTARRPASRGARRPAVHAGGPSGHLRRGRRSGSGPGRGGRFDARRGGRPGPAGRLDPARQPAVQPRRSGHPQLRPTMDPRLEHDLIVSRRNLLKGSAWGLGAAALGNLLHAEGPGPGCDGGRFPRGAALRAAGQARHLAVHVRRSVPDRPLGSQAQAAGHVRPGHPRLGRGRPALHHDDLGPGALSDRALDLRLRPPRAVRHRGLRALALHRPGGG